jgi:exosortase D (VPLPA-CTERM-specific)
MLQTELNEKNWWVPPLIVLGCLVLSYWSVIVSLVTQMMNNEDFSGGLLVVPISAYLIWQKREALKNIEIKTDWRALAVLVLAMLIYVVGELGAELFTTRVSMIVFVIGSAWLIFGLAFMRLLWFPFFFLFLMLPLPGFIYRNITFPLQIISSALSVELLHGLGVSAYREGNVIDMGFSQFQVVEACNGLRFILPLLIIGFLLAYLGRKPFWKRALLVLSSVPIAILANVLRIAGTGVIAKYYGTEAAEGFFHSFSGWVVFMVCFGFFALFNLALAKLPGKSQKQPAETPPSSSREKTRVIRWSPAATAAGLLLIAPFVVGNLGTVAPVPLKQSIEAFPLSYSDWNGRSGRMADKMWEKVGGQEYVMIDYSKDGERPVNFYAAYYEYQRKAGDFIHSPKLCLPGAGWYIRRNSVRELPLRPTPARNGSETLKFNEIMIQKNDQNQLVYYWYQGRGRNFTSEYTAKFYMVWDGIFRRRTDGALVRLIRTIGPGESIEDGRRVLDDFAVFVAEELAEYLPS